MLKTHLPIVERHTVHIIISCECFKYICIFNDLLNYLILTYSSDITMDVNIMQYTAGFKADQLTVNVF